MDFNAHKSEYLMRPNRPGWARTAAYINAPNSMEWKPKPAQAGNLTLISSCYGSSFYPWTVGDRMTSGSWTITSDPISGLYQYARQSFEVNPPAMTADAAYAVAGLASFPSVYATKLAPKMWADPIAAAACVMDALHYWTPSSNLANTEPRITGTYTLAGDGYIPDGAISSTYAGLSSTMADRDGAEDEWVVPGYGRYNEWEFSMAPGITSGDAMLKTARRWQTLCPTIVTVSLYSPGSYTATTWDGGTGIGLESVTGQTTACSTADGTAYGVTSPGSGRFWETPPAAPPPPEKTPAYYYNAWTGVNLTTHTADISPVIPHYRAALMEEYNAP